MPGLRAVSLCPAVAAVGGYTRTECGLLFYSQTGHHVPANFPIDRNFETSTAVTWGDGNIGWVHNPGGRTDPSDFSGRPTAFGATRFWLPKVAPRRFAFIQVALGEGTTWAELDAGPVMQDSIGRRAVALWNLQHGSLGNKANDHSATDAGGGNFQMTITGFCRFGLEVFEGTREVRAFHDAGNGDPREDRIGGFYPAITSLGTDPFRMCIESSNGVNGFQITGAMGDVVVTKRRAIAIEDMPTNGSVRVSVNGVVQLFAGLTYLNAAAGLVTWDPAAGVYFPALMRYEIFSAPALAGVLVADLSVPAGWGGDRIGIP